MSGLPDLTRRDTYAAWSSEKLRFSDTDMLGHVNNVAFAALIESGRTSFTQHMLRNRAPRNFSAVMARLEIDYRAELHWPADIDVGTKILAFGRTSMRVGNGVFHGAICAATAITVLVVIDRTTRKPTMIPQDVKEFLESQIGAAK